MLRSSRRLYRYMKRNVQVIKTDLVSLQRYADYLVSIFGDAFIKQIESSESKNTSSLIELNRVKDHPFTHWWQQFNIAITLKKSNPNIGFSQGALYCLGLAACLKSVSNLDNFERIITSLINRSKFYSTVFEVYTLYEFKISNFSLSIIEEHGSNKSPDFFLNLDGKSIFIECKSIEDIVLSEERSWYDFGAKLCKLLEKNIKSWMVEVTTQVPISRKLIEQLNTSIYGNITANKTTSCKLSDTVSYNISEISVWGNTSIDITELIKSGKIGYAEAEVNVDNREAKNFFKSRAVVVNPIQSSNSLTNKIIKAFKKASKQLPKDSPGIIYIGLPHQTGEDFLQAIDSSFDDIFHRLNNDTRKANLVIISANILQHHRLTPIDRQQYIIPNHNAAYKFPKSFSLPGTNQLGLDFIENEGTITFEFVPGQEWGSGYSKPILSDIKDNGSSQLIIWKTWRDTLRMEIIGKSGRTYVESDVIAVNNSSPNRFGGRWNSRELEIYIDGNRVGRNVYN